LSQHATLAELRAFALGQLEDPRFLALVGHLRQGCEMCLMALEAEMLRPDEPGDALEDSALPPAEEAAYESALDRVFAAVLRHAGHARRERVKTHEALERLSAAGAAGLVGAPRRLRGLGGYYALLERCQELRNDDPRQMVDLARLAVSVAERLSPERYGAQQVADFRCRAWIELGNAWRAADRLHEAERALGEAADLLRKGTGDLLLEARLFDVQASLFADRRQFDVALESLDTVHALYLALGDRHLAGRALLSKGVYTRFAGDPEEALRLLRQGAATIDEARDPALAWLAVHNQADFMVDLGRFREARTLLTRNRWRFGGRIQGVKALKLRWLEGRIHAGLGELDRAEQAFLDARQGFEAAELPYTAATLLLELAILALRQGRAAQARDAVLEAVGVFTTLEIRREVLAAVLLLQKSFETGVATGALLETVLQFMTRAESDPTAQWQG
jgi:tetratricopeptide (TPR) repeat protein